MEANDMIPTTPSRRRFNSITALLVTVLAFTSFAVLPAQDPADATSYVRRGVTKHRLGDYAGAVADYTKALELDPKNVNAYYIRG